MSGRSGLGYTLSITGLIHTTVTSFFLIIVNRNVEKLSGPALGYRSPVDALVVRPTGNLKHVVHRKTVATCKRDDIYVKQLRLYSYKSSKESVLDTIACDLCKGKKTCG